MPASKMRRPHLRDQLVEDFDAPGRQGARQFEDGSRKRGSAHQYQVAAHVQRRILPRELHGVFEGLTGGHQSGRRQNSTAVRLDDPLIHIARKAEVIGIDHQALHWSPESGIRG